MPRLASLLIGLAAVFPPTSPEEAVRKFVEEYDDSALTEPVACATKGDLALCQHSGFYYLCSHNSGCNPGWSCVDLPSEFPQEFVP